MLSFLRKNTISDGELAQISRQYTNHNDEIQVGQDASLIDLGYNSSEELKETIYGELIRFFHVFIDLIDIVCAFRLPAHNTGP